MFEHAHGMAAIRTVTIAPPPLTTRQREALRRLEADLAAALNEIRDAGEREDVR